MTDMYCHRIVRSYGILIPDIFIDLVDGKNLALILHQKQQNVIFDRCQFYILTIYGNFL